MLPTAQQIIELLSLDSHPEGGYYFRTYRSKKCISVDELGNGFEGARTLASAIYYLVLGDRPSKFHRLRTDEIWHFYFGSPFVLVEVFPNGEVTQTVLGDNLLAGEKCQHTVQAGNWFGGYATNSTTYSLLGCTISPGFDERDFELGDLEDLKNLAPASVDLITKIFKG